MNRSAVRADAVRPMTRLVAALVVLLLLAACGDRGAERSATPDVSAAASSTKRAPQTSVAGGEGEPTADQTKAALDAEPDADMEGRLQMTDPAELDRTWAQTTSGDQGGGPMASQAVGGFDDEVKAERAAQRNLPTADGPIWAILRKTRISIDEKSQLYHASHPAEVRALAGRRLTLRGYMLPLEADDRTAHFLISPYTPVCFFHPPAEPNEIVEVRLRRPIAAGYHLVEVSGVLQLADNGEKGLFFVMDAAEGRIVQRIE
ncbi:DUF3299 domain-containing protein [Brevundimonas sp. SORGH_AS_0993]|uniref:DUF3299 domain-containing protein n=1 Tax=Brevundimonas sp. SORGH_AS_0993 TaxID=3041794 RepID=UPI00278347A4|nr:DUF3299 domain-containing protein [Brevundimonas sp. SORGH_AS_0993]MDQ1153400.1 hypothetical protein [Brevundimonas sp. SORGH_AS_0993]